MSIKFSEKDIERDDPAWLELVALAEKHQAAIRKMPIELESKMDGQHFEEHFAKVREETLNDAKRARLKDRLAIAIMWVFLLMGAAGTAACAMMIWAIVRMHARGEI